jgi:hypothetical protein
MCNICACMHLPVYFSAIPAITAALEDTCSRCPCTHAIHHPTTAPHPTPWSPNLSARMQIEAEQRASVLLPETPLLLPQLLMSSGDGQGTLMVSHYGGQSAEDLVWSDDWQDSSAEERLPTAKRFIACVALALHQMHTLVRWLQAYMYIKSCDMLRIPGWHRPACVFVLHCSTTSCITCTMRWWKGTLGKPAT